MIASQRCGGDSGAPPQLAGDEDFVVHEADLKKRREVSPADFTPKNPPRSSAAGRGAPMVAMAPPPPPPAAPGGDVLDLDARRKQRAEDPEDLKRARREDRAGGRAAAGKSRRVDDMLGDDEVLVAPMPSDSKGPGAKKGNKRGALVAPAGTVLAASLDTPIELAGNSSSVVATVDEGALAGAKLVGVASLSGRRVVVRFRRLLMVDGTEVDVHAEARDDDGGFGLAVVLPEQVGDEPSIGQEIAEETATDAVVDAVGGGVIGGAAKKYARRSKHKKKYGGGKVTVTIAAGRPLAVFLHESAEMRD
jgi:hypothetical protein